MPQQYVVKQGDHLTRIADANGFKDFTPIWNHADNAALKQKRKNPHILLPGDVVVIPDTETKQESGATEQRHRFKVLLKPLTLRIKLLGLDSRPLARTELDLAVDGGSETLATQGDGTVEKPLTAAADKGTIKFRDKETPFDERILIEIRVGHLDPVEVESGQRGRLNALGYDAGNPDESGDGSLLFRSAVEEFQCDQKLTVDGVAGANTQKKLQEVYGC